MRLLGVIFTFAFFGFATNGYSQDEVVHPDSLIRQSDGIETFVSISEIDPNRASLYAAVLPGMGQVYNKQSWKLPFVYGGFMLFGHYINDRHQLYTAFRNAYLAETDGDPNTVNPFGSRFGASSILQRNAEKMRRDRDYLMILGTLYYLLTIVDAHIAAHLSEFNVNDDLSFQVQPTMYNGNQYTAQNVGISLVWYLNK